MASKPWELIPTALACAVADSPSSFIPLYLLEAAEAVLRVASREAFKDIATHKGRRRNPEYRATARLNAARADILVAAIAKRAKVLDGRALSNAKCDSGVYGGQRERQALLVAEDAQRTALDVEAMDDLGAQEWYFIARVDADYAGTVEGLVAVAQGTVADEQPLNLDSWRARRCRLRIVQRAEDDDAATEYALAQAGRLDEHAKLLAGKARSALALGQRLGAQADAHKEAALLSDEGILAYETALREGMPAAEALTAATPTMSPARHVSAAMGEVEVATVHDA
jgi:hypothetical protein